MKMFEQREQAKEDSLSNTTKTMLEAAPKVLDLSKRVRDLVDEQESELGPAASRWNEFMAGKVGAPNPDFAKLRTDVSLLQTLLMRMHTGARGGQYIMQHFGDLINAGKQSPENMLATLDEIDQYANDVAKTPMGMLDKRGGTSVKTPAKPPAPAGGSAGGFDWSAHPEVKQ
jgi:chemotaxis regulatin CheY-phosphate phosphatase CheZ